MEIYDVLMLVVVLACVVLGAWKGLIWAMLTMATLLGSYFTALNVRGSLAHIFGGGESGTSWAMLAVFAVMCVVLAVLFRLGSKFISRLKLQHYDRLSGSVVGFFNGALMCVLLSVFAVMFSGYARDLVRQSDYSGPALTQVANKVPTVMPAEAHRLWTPEG